jgi:phage terminase large subunit
MENNSSREIELNPAFSPLFEDNLDDPRYYQVYGGRGSGKSFAAAIAMVQLTYSKYKHKILYLRQTMTSLEDSSIADIRAAIILIGAQADFRESKGTITNIRTGGSIVFKGIRSAGTQTAKLKSLSGITTLVIEEAEEVESFEEFSKVDESIRIAGKPLKIVLIYNPTSAVKSWIHKEWFTEGLPKQERFTDTIYIHSTYLDNIDNLNPSVVRRYDSLKETNPTYYRNTILAEWTLEVSGRIYAGWGQYPIFEQPGDTWYGLDFGYGGNDKTACIKVTWFEDVYYVEEMFSEAKLSIRSTLTKMRRAGIPFNAKIYADSAMPLLITEIRQGGYTSIRKAYKGNVEAGIKKVQDKSIVMIGDDTSDLYYHYMTFKRDKKGKLPHEPDILAALRYGINSRTPIKNPGKPQKRRARRRKGFL